MFSPQFNNGWPTTTEVLVSLSVLESKASCWWATRLRQVFGFRSWSKLFQQFLAGGRKDECSAYLTHLSRAVVTKDVAQYTLFVQACARGLPNLWLVSVLSPFDPNHVVQADALNHVWPHYLHLVMRSIQAAWDSLAYGCHWSTLSSASLLVLASKV